VVVTRRGRSGKSIRHKLRTTHDIRVSHDPGDFGMRWEQPKFSRAESEGRAMAPRRGKHRGVDRRATFDLARSSESQTKCVRSDSGRSRLRHARGPEESDWRIDVLDRKSVV